MSHVTHIVCVYYDGDGEMYDVCIIYLDDDECYIVLYSRELRVVVVVGRA